MTNGMAPSYLEDLLPTRIDRALRNEGDFNRVTAKTSAHYNSFIPRTTRDWNELDDETKSQGTLKAFSNRLNKDHVSPPKWFNSGCRKYNILHARLRMLCSPLNDHLYSHIHVVDSPACPCGHERENNKHYLMDCPLYDAARQTLFNSLQQIGFECTLANMLYGSAAYSVNKNTQAFNLIQDFIENSERFE